MFDSIAVWLLTPPGWDVPFSRAPDESGPPLLPAKQFPIVQLYEVRIPGRKTRGQNTIMKAPLLLEANVSLSVAAYKVGWSI